MRSGRAGTLRVKVHLTETCDDDAPNLITDVTTPATTTDFAVLPRIQEHLAVRNLTPREQRGDAGYLSLIIWSRAAPSTPST